MLIVGNWKMNGSLALCEEFIQNLKKQDNIVICPPMVFAEKLINSLHKVAIGAQDCSQFKRGAYTGDISCEILRDIGVKYAIIGHSERVKYYRETNSMILEKTYRCIENNIKPIVCVDINFEEIIQELRDVCDQIFVAYEPSSAIGTGIVPTNHEISCVLQKIMACSNFKILYGGSVKSENIGVLKLISEVSGFLVGGASLKVNEFNTIIEICLK